MSAQPPHNGLNQEDEKNSSPRPFRSDGTAGMFWHAQVLGSTSSPSRARERTVGAIVICALLVLWEILARFDLIDARFFPAPTVIVSSIMSPDGFRNLLGALGITLYRVLVGFVSGVCVGIVVGLIAGMNKYVAAIVTPLVGALYPIPKIAILPLVILIFGLGDVSLFIVVFIGVVFPVLLNTLAGVRAIDPIYRDVGKNVHATRWRVFWTIALPGALPGIITGIRVAWGMALLIIIGSEFIAAKSGLGYIIYYSWQTFDVALLWGGLATVSIFGIVSFAFLDLCERLLIPWRRVYT